MFDIERWQEIFEAIGKNKLRTFLTGVSVGSGIFILVVLLGIGNGMKQGIQKEFEKDAATELEFWSGQTSMEYKGMNPNRWISLTNDDFNYAGERYFDELEHKTANFRRWGAMATYKNESGNYTLRGCMPDMQYIENVKMNAGRFFSEKDMQNSAKVVVIGIRVALDLFKDYTKAVGELIKINDLSYKVIGVYSDPGGEREEATLYAPHTTVTQVYNSPRSAGSFSFTLNPEDDFDKANSKATKFIEQFSNYLKRKHNVHPDDEKGIQSFNKVEEAKKFFTLNKMMALFFWGIGLLTLVAGIVGVANIMLIIVKERTKEIGIRKALGAKPRSIIAMILHESIFITAISGFIGLLLGLGLLEIIGPFIDTPFIANPRVDFSVAISTVILLVIAGAVAGFVPARHAAKVKPIIALRDE